MSNYMWGDQQTQFFFELTPHLVLDAIEDLKIKVTGRCMTLNSMENRVYEIEVEDDISNFASDFSGNFLVAKFYRPGRWTLEQIQEEHDFLLELFELEIPVVPPIQLDGKSIFKLPNGEIFYSIFPRFSGRAPDEFSDSEISQLGRLLGRLHNVGKQKKANHRLSLTPETYGIQNLHFLLTENILPSHLATYYQKVVEEICSLSMPLFAKASTQRVHGDCHLGNIIKRDHFYLIDFDDMIVAPPVQDVWPLIPGRDEYSIRQRNNLLEAYEEMCPFDWSSLKLIEPLRSLRMIHFSAWIAKRWDDPSFKIAFPHFEQPDYWDIQLQDLKNQLNFIKSDLDQGNFYSE